MENTELNKLLEIGLDLMEGLVETNEESTLWYENICTDCHDALTRVFKIYPNIEWDRIPENCGVVLCERCASGDRATFTIRKLVEEVKVDTSRMGFNGFSGFDLSGNTHEVVKYRNFSYESTEEFWKSIGFLASHAELVAFVVEKNEDSFLQRYYELKEREPLRFTLISNPKQWGNELRVIVEPSWNLTLGNIIPVTGNTENRINFNSNSLVWWLLELGFDLGRNHDVESIRSSVPNEFKEAFDEGYSSE